MFSLSLANRSVFSGVRVSDPGTGPDFNNCNCVPPDVQIAAGPTQEVEMVNTAYEVIDANGSAITGGSLSSFFSSGSDFLSDPKVLYDNLSGRWFASIFDYGTAGHVLLAVSGSADATGSWKVYKVPTPSGTFPDQPILGVSEGAIGLTGDIFDASTGGFYGAEFWVVNKSDALAGGTLNYTSFGPSVTMAEVHAVQSVSVSPALYFAMSRYGGSVSAIETIQATGVPPAAVSIVETNLTVGSIGVAPGAPQPFTSSTIDPGDSRVESAVWRSSLLWLTLSDACQLPTDTITRGCARLIQIDTTNGTVVQDFDTGLPGSGLYYPALSVSDRGGLTVVVGASSSTMYPSVFATGWVIGEPTPSLQPAQPVVNGSASDGCGGACRFGDYFGAAQVPGAETAWVAGEYIGSSTIPWQTAYGLVRIAGPPEVDLSAAPTGVDVGQSTNVTVLVSNPPCTAGSGFYCTLGIPLPTGAYSFACGLVPIVASFGITFSTPGNYTIGAGGSLEVYSTSNCSTSSLVSTVAVTPVVIGVTAAPSVVVTASRPLVADAGQPVTFSAGVTGGFAPFTFRWTGLPAGCLDSGAAIMVCNATTGATVTVTVTVTDGHLAVVAGGLSYRWNSAVAVDLAPDRSQVDVGGILFLTATASGGTGAYDYLWLGLPPGCLSQDTSSLGCGPTDAGPYFVTVTATDALGGTATSLEHTIYVLPTLTISLTTSARTVDVGHDLVLTATAGGGASPFSYSWVGLPPGCTPTNGSTLTCAPDTAGQYTVRVTVADATGMTTSAILNVSATGAPSSGLAGSLTSGWIWVGVLVLLVAAGVLIVVVRSRGRRTSRRPPGPSR